MKRYVCPHLLHVINIRSYSTFSKGFLKWEEARNTWISTATATQENCRAKTEAKALDVDEIIDLIFSQRWRSQSPERSQFPEAVPLPQMVDILVDLWEAEGLDI